MTEFLKTLLFLNIQGSVFVILLFLLKSVIQRSFSGKAQRRLWIMSAIVFLLPLWNLVPANTAPPIILPHYSEDVFIDVQGDMASKEETRGENLEPIIKTLEKYIDFRPVVLSVWGAGVCLFLLLTVGEYVIFLVKKRKKSENTVDDEFLSILQFLDIQQKIKLRKCDDADSPMLTGVFFPVVYIPKNSLTKKELTYIYSHELTHYKHKDLLIKWLICIVNAVNWFNPFMYLVMKNLNEACELYCDETVTSNMNDEHKKEYMNTILNLIAKKGKK